MKNKKILAILTIAAGVSVFAAGCSFGGDEPEEQVVVDAVKAAGLEVLEVNHQGEWVSVVARKNA